MTRRLKNIISIIGILLFFLYLILTVPSDKEIVTILNNNFSQISLNGIVVDKFIDRNQHSYKIIIIKGLNIDSVYRLNFTRESNHMYNSLNVNDTILKRKSERVIYRMKEGKMERLGTVEFK